MNHCREGRSGPIRFRHAVILLDTHRAHDYRCYRQAATSQVGRGCSAAPAPGRGENAEHLKMAACLTYKSPLKIIFEPAAEKCLNLREPAVFACSLPRQCRAARQVNIANVRTFLK